MAKINKQFFNTEAETKGVRINKYLSDAGICSRREADKHIEAGDVMIEGERATLGSKVLKGQEVIFCGKAIEPDRKLVLIAFHKPQGIVCTTDRRDPNNIIDFIDYGSRIYPIGRLDKDSEGLILLTNNGNIVNKILRAGNHHEKEYIVAVNKPLSADFLKKMSEGVPILDTITKPCFVEAINKLSFRIVLTQGLNRQIRRMCEAMDYRVTSLQRIRIMNINLGRLKSGTYRNLTEWELDELNELIKDSANAPMDGKQLESAVPVFDEKKNLSTIEKRNYSGKQRRKTANMMNKEAKPLKTQNNSKNTKKRGLKSEQPKKWFKNLKETRPTNSKEKEQSNGRKTAAHQRTRRTFK